MQVCKLTLHIKSGFCNEEHERKEIYRGNPSVFPALILLMFPDKSLDELFDAFFQREVRIPPWSVITHGSVVVRHSLQRVLSDL
jgi:hypothetical protein